MLGNLNWVGPLLSISIHNHTTNPALLQTWSIDMRSKHLHPQTWKQYFYECASYVKCFTRSMINFSDIMTHSIKVCLKQVAWYFSCTAWLFWKAWGRKLKKLNQRVKVVSNFEYNLDFALIFRVWGDSRDLLISTHGWLNSDGSSNTALFTVLHRESCPGTINDQYI